MSVAIFLETSRMRRKVFLKENLMSSRSLTMRCICSVYSLSCAAVTVPISIVSATTRRERSSESSVCLILFLPISISCLLLTPSVESGRGPWETQRGAKSVRGLPVATCKMRLSAARGFRPTYAVCLLSLHTALLATLDEVLSLAQVHSRSLLLSWEQQG